MLSSPSELTERYRQAHALVPEQPVVTYRRGNNSDTYIELEDGRSAVLSPVGDRLCDAPEPGALNSPDSRRQAFRRGDDLWLRDLGDGSQWRLTSDGEPFRSWGATPDYSRALLPLAVSDQVLPPAMTCFSPSGRWVLTARLDERDMPEHPFVDQLPVDRALPRLRPVRYHHEDETAKGDHQLGLGAITSGNLVVRDILRVDEERRAVIFVAGCGDNERNPYWRTVFRADLDGGNQTMRTPEPADHELIAPTPQFYAAIFGDTPSSSISPSGTWFVDHMSTVSTPPTILLRDTRTGAVAGELERADVTALLYAGFPVPEQFHVTADDGETELWGLITLPHDVPAGSRVPVIDLMYAGFQVVTQPFGWLTGGANPAWGQMGAAYAALGFATVVLDGRGTPGRDRRFRQWTHGVPAEPRGIEDHVTAIRALAEEYPIDLERVGVTGHSYGGYNSVRSILCFPDFFKVAVSSAGVHDARKMPKGSWNWFLGDADPHDPQALDDLGNLHLAQRLRGRLLLLCGDNDVNATMDHTLALIRAFWTPTAGSTSRSGQAATTTTWSPRTPARSCGTTSSSTYWVNDRRPTPAGSHVRNQADRGATPPRRGRGLGHENSSNSRRNMTGSAHPELGTVGRKVPVTGKRAVASSQHAVVTEVMLDTLRSGGNAVDAAIAGSLVQAVVQQDMTNHAGTVTALVHDASTEEIAELNSMGTIVAGLAPFAPIPTGKGLYAQLPGTPCAVVPGFMPGMKALHERFGTQPWDTVCAPAVQLAEEGHVVTSFEHLVMAQTVDFFLHTESGRKHFTPGGHLPQVGARWASAELATTMRNLAAEGPDYFLTGKWAQDFVARGNALGWPVKLDHLTAIPHAGRLATASSTGATPSCTSQHRSARGSTARSSSAYSTNSTSPPSVTGRTAQRRCTISPTRCAAPRTKPVCSTTPWCSATLLRR